jgi:hypothetical protein
MARNRSACYLSIALITFMSGSRTFLNFGAKMPPDRHPVRQARSAALHNGLRALGTLAARAPLPTRERWPRRRCRIWTILTGRRGRETIGWTWQFVQPARVLIFKRTGVGIEDLIAWLGVGQASASGSARAIVRRNPSPATRGRERGSPKGWPSSRIARQSLHRSRRQIEGRSPRSFLNFR